MARETRPVVLYVGAFATLIGRLFFVGMSCLMILVEGRTLGHSWTDRASRA
jgi:hypothetical protein